MRQSYPLSGTSVHARSGRTCRRPTPIARRPFCYDRSRPPTDRLRSCARFASSVRTDTSDSPRYASRASGSASRRGPTTSRPTPAATTSARFRSAPTRRRARSRWQPHDLEHMLLASRELGVPMIIGSSGDTGSNSRVDLYVRIIRELAAKHRLPRFRLGYFYSEVDKEDLRGEDARRRNGRGARRAARRSTEAELDATERIVAMAGVHPFIELLEAGRRRDHRRAQQRQLRLRRAGDPSRLSRGPRVLPRQGARVRVVLRRALRRQGDGAGRDHRGRRQGHRHASRRSAARWRRWPDTRCTSARIRTSSTSPAACST